MDVGVKELRANLSRYLDRVRAGEHVIVTDRGRAVARLTPLEGDRRIDKLVAEGLVEAAPSPRRRPRRPVRTSGTVSDLVADQRR